MDQEPTLTVLFVCSGNICRSAMADAVCRRLARRRGLSWLDVRSAGTLRISGVPASPEAIQALGEIDIDLTAHRSSPLSVESLEQADAIIVMDRTHEREVRALAPGSESRMHRLLAFERSATPARDAGELDDPVGRPVGVFRRQRSRMVDSIDHLLDYLADRRGGARS